MRKFVTFGLGALAAATLALGPASPAQAVIVPPGSVTDQVCLALPGGVVGIVNQLVANGTLTGLLTTELTGATADLNLKTTDLVNAIIDHINTIDGGGNVASTAAVVSARASSYSDAAARWTKAVKDLDAAQLAAQVLTMQNSVLSAINGGLCV